MASAIHLPCDWFRWVSAILVPSLLCWFLPLAMESDSARLGASLSLTEEEESGVDCLRAFNLVRGVDFKLIERKHFLLKFFYTLDRDRVLGRCPWAYDKNLLVLAPVDTTEDPNIVDLNWCKFHINIHGLLLGKMTKGIASFIGKKLRKFKDVDLDSNVKCGDLQFVLGGRGYHKTSEASYEN
ncbi:UNVERIFIED_CONTAM: hypothetical protein Scaly_1170600 [Sesamum calycinum]|uniref:DUF4283 domain-containing protein n=1 Tax=Sesamum calycinum TaxID=2727403 RepID=A0AAW2Q2S6_9LAMI